MRALDIRRNVAEGTRVYSAVDALRLDLRYAIRGLIHRPGFALLAVLTLAIGIGVNTVAFSALNALLLRPFDVKNADRLGWIMTKAPGSPHGNMSLPDFADLQRSSRAFDAIVAEGRLPVSWRTGQGASQAWALLVSTDYLRLLDAPIEQGRAFTAADLTSSEIPAVVSHRFWTEALGGGDSVAGRTIVLNGQTFAITGVLRDTFQGPGGLYTPDVWIPLDRIDVMNQSAVYRSRSDAWLTVVGHLRDGVTRAEADADLQGIFAQMARAYPASDATRSAAFYVMADGHPDLRSIAPLAWIALAVVGVVLLIACFNVAGLLLARASERQREIGVRAALGATRGRILRQMLTEGVLLALLSGAASLMLAAWSADLLAAFSLPSPIPQRLQFGINLRLVEFTALLVVISGVLPALLPALQATRASLFRTMKAEAPLGSGRSRLRNAFVVAQVAGSTLFLAAALLFVRSFANTTAVDPGFDTAHVLVLELNTSTYGYDAARSRVFFDSLVRRVGDLPGVTNVALADRIPFYVGFPSSEEISTDGTDCAVADCRRATEYRVGHGHFAALGIPLVAGRDFTPEELKNGSAAIVSEQMASRFWPDGRALGQVFRAGADAHPYEVVGIAADIKHRSMSEPPGAFMYRPLEPADYAEPITLVVRTAGNPRALIGAVAAQVQGLDPDLPARTARTMTERMEMPLWPARTIAGFSVICGVLALILATVGLFGVTYYAVNQRTREFGIRVALGASPRAVMSLVLREGLTLTLPGVAIGIGGALLAGRLVARLLFGISASDPLTLAATAALEAMVALAACALPAYRATRADPMVALRQE